SATSASTSSVAGLTVLRLPPSAGSTKDPLMNRPYEDRISTMERDSGAGAYSKRGMVSVQGDVVGSGVHAGGQLHALHEQVVEQSRGAEAEPSGIQPVLAGRLVDGHEIAQGVLAGPDAAGRLDPHLASGLTAEVPHRLQHYQRHRERG